MGLGIGPNGVKWLVKDEAEVGPRVHSSSICGLQLICHGLAQGKVKSLCLKVKMIQAGSQCLAGPV